MTRFLWRARSNRKLQKGPNGVPGFSENQSGAGEKVPPVAANSPAHLEEFGQPKLHAERLGSQVGAACAHLLQYLADTLAPEDEEDDDDQEQDNGHKAADQNGRAVVRRVLGRRTGSCGEEFRGK